MILWYFWSFWYKTSQSFANKMMLLIFQPSGTWPKPLKKFKIFLFRDKNIRSKLPCFCDRFECYYLILSPLWGVLCHIIDFWGCNLSIEKCTRADLFIYYWLLYIWLISYSFTSMRCLISYYWFLSNFFD